MQLNEFSRILEFKNRTEWGENMHSTEYLSSNMSQHVRGKEASLQPGSEN